MSPFISEYLEPLSYLIYAITLWWRCRTAPSVKIKVLIGYYLLAILLVSYAMWYGMYNSTAESNNNWVYNILYFVSAFFLSFYMYKTLIHIKNKIITLSLLLAVVVVFLRKGLILEQHRIDSFAISISVLSLIVLIFLYFQQVLRNVNEQNILLHYDFWLISSYLLYFLGSFFIFMSWSYLSSRIVGRATPRQAAQFGTLWGVHNILLFIGALITFIGNVWITRYQKKSLP